MQIQYNMSIKAINILKEQHFTDRFKFYKYYFNLSIRYSLTE